MFSVHTLFLYVGKADEVRSLLISTLFFFFLMNRVSPVAIQNPINILRKSRPPLTEPHLLSAGIRTLKELCHELSTRRAFKVDFGTQVGRCCIRVAGGFTAPVTTCFVGCRKV